jgi:hypothetical protein
MKKIVIFLIAALVFFPGFMSVTLAEDADKNATLETEESADLNGTKAKFDDLENQTKTNFKLDDRENRP